MQEERRSGERTLIEMGDGVRLVFFQVNLDRTELHIGCAHPRIRGNDSAGLNDLGGGGCGEECGDDWESAVRIGSTAEGARTRLDPALELLAAVARLLAELPQAGFLRRLRLVDQTGWEFDADRADRRTVLQDDRDREWAGRVLD